MPERVLVDVVALIDIAAAQVLNWTFAAQIDKLPRHADFLSK
jgi:hypothetical protein